MPGPTPLGPTTNQSLLYAAMRKAGMVLAPGRMPNSDQLAEAMGEENRMIGGWNTSRLDIFAERIDLWPTVASQQAYTIGIDPTGNSTANWSGPRPREITAANFLLPTDADPVKRVRRAFKIWNRQQWSAVRFQAVYSYPEVLYYDKQCDPITGFAKVYFRPIPDAIYSIELFTWQPVSQFGALNDVVILPPGYEDAIVNNLAVRLDSMPYPVKVPMNPQVAIDAAKSLATLRQMNAQAPRLRSDKELTDGRGWYNWLSGQTEE